MIKVFMFFIVLGLFVLGFIFALILRVVLWLRSMMRKNDVEQDPMEDGLNSEQRRARERGESYTYRPNNKKSQAEDDENPFYDANATRQSSAKQQKKKIFAQDEGEYVDFEEL